MSKIRFTLFQAAPFKFCWYFWFMNPCQFWSKTINQCSIRINLLHFHVKIILASLVGTVEVLKIGWNIKWFCNILLPKYFLPRRRPKSVVRICVSFSIPWRFGSPYLKNKICSSLGQKSSCIKYLFFISVVFVLIVGFVARLAISSILFSISMVQAC